MINILFVHPLEGNAYELFKAFQRNENVNIIPLLENESYKAGLLYKIRHKLKIPLDRYDVNQKLLSYDLLKIDVVFIVKGNEVHPKTLKKIKSKYPQIRLVSWSLDDMYAWHNRSFFYTLSLRYYDLVVTTKSYNVQELPLLGANKVLFHYQAYSNDIHKPRRCTESYNHDVVFIGYPEKERITSILYLAYHGIKIDIYGYPSAWKKPKYNIKHENITLHEEALYDKNYSEALSCAKVSLCFLRKVNRDLHTSRSIEIPACGGFMIAERTDEHLELFEENVEAVYFDNNEELLTKVKYYLEHEEERKKIAFHGLSRCKSSGYSYDDIVVKIVDEVNKL